MADPDLRLPHYSGISKIKAKDILTPSVIQKQTLTLQGMRALKHPSSEARITSVTGTETTIEFDSVDRKSIEVELVVPNVVVDTSET